MKTFKDIMQRYYDDEKLGIKKEDAPVNATGVAVAGTGDDSSTVVVKKKKKPYDGRTREAKAFLKRMIERQSKLNKEEIELDEKKKLRLYRVSGKNAQGNIEAKDEKEAEKLARKKGIKGKLSITDRGPVTGEIPSYESVELDEFNKMTVTVNDPKQRKKVFDDLKKQKRLDVSMGPGKTIKVDGKGKALNLFAKDIMNFYDAEIRAEEIEEDAKMAKQSDDNLKSLMKKFRDMEKKDPKMPSTQFMIKRIGKEMKKRGLKEEQLDENQKIHLSKGYIEKITPDQVTKMFGYKDKNQIKAVIKMVRMSGIKVQQDMQKRNPSGYDRMITKLGNDSSFLKNEQDMSNMCCNNCGDMFGKPTAESSCQYNAYDPTGDNWIPKNEYSESVEYFKEGKKEFHLFDNEKEAQAFAKKSGGKLVKGVNKSKGKFAVVIEEVKPSFIDDIKEKMSTYSSDLMLNESNLKIVQDIVKRKSAKNIKFKDGSLKVDMFTASALSQIYDKVNTDNKKKMEKMMNGTKDQFMKLAKFALSKVG